ncbi:helix-turn-helix domain-containing protein [Variovorax sp. LjRoot175]|uniref:helix-turn-helix domain-containing protein n=1 Tax=Variovorax sp. LjRoot175 TaxID=3342276 RepID=UPI003ECF2A9E
MPDTPRNSKHSASLLSAHTGVMLVDDRRSLYRGRLVEAIDRNFGGHVIYVGLDGPLLFKRGKGSWECATIATAPPHALHSVRASNGYVAQVLLEEEDVSSQDLPAWVKSSEVDPLAEPAASRLRARMQAINVPSEEEVSLALDMALFGMQLPKRSLDERIARVVSAIQAEPGAAHSAAACALLVGLSQSRFLHLFAAELGTPFRRFRAWKRARGLLGLLHQDCSLTEMALDSGYADSSHFSNAIRCSYGLRPRDIVAGGRRMQTIHVRRSRTWGLHDQVASVGHLRSHTQMP